MGMTKTDMIRSYLESGDYTRTVVAKYFQISYEEVKKIERTLYETENLSENEKDIKEECYIEYCQRQFLENNDISKHPFYNYDLKTDLRYIQGGDKATRDVIKALLEYGQLTIESIATHMDFPVEEVEIIKRDMELNTNSPNNQETENTDS